MSDVSLEEVLVCLYAGEGKEDVILIAKVV